MIDSTDRFVYEYLSAAAGSTRFSLESDYDNDGIADFRQAVSTTYDSNGYLETQVAEDDHDADGTIDSRVSYESHADSRGRTLSLRLSTDANADGIFESTTELTTEYDDLGNPKIVTTVYDTGADGQADLVVRQTSGYGPDGQPLDQALDTRTSGATDFESSSTSTFESLAMPDGVRTLAQQYLDGFGGIIGGNAVSLPYPPPPF